MRDLLTEPVSELRWEGVDDDLRFHDVGIHKKVGLIGDPFPMLLKYIKGKAVVDDFCVYSIPPDILNLD